MLRLRTIPFFLATLGALSGPALAQFWTNSETVLTTTLFWEKGAESFPSFFKDGAFQWTSDRKEALRSTKPGARFASLPVVETLIWMKATKPGEASLSLYNRGDCAPLDEAAFLDLLQTAQKNLAALMRPGGSASNPSLSKGFPPKRQVWKKGDLGFVLEWESSQKNGSSPSFQAEYVRLRLLPAGQVASEGADRQVSAFAASQKRLTSKGNGDVYLPDVPMVDQGPKGYCAVAATERVLRYYGSSFDQHQIAQIAGTEAGTNPAALARALSRASVKMRITLDILEDFSVPEFVKLVKTYNMNARKADKSEIKLPASGTIDINAVYAAMDGGVLLETRTRNPTGLTRFAGQVREHIQGRVPLVWCVMLGLVPETSLTQARGGHIRLIIGYNERSGELLYTDSWGAGHELKRMTLAQAYSITTMLFSIRPQ